MAKTKRRQARNRRKQDKAKEQRKSRAALTRLKAAIQPDLDEADRLMKEAEELFRQAVLERQDECQPSVNVSASFVMRGLFDALENDKGFKSAFHDRPADWQPPRVMDTRYAMFLSQYGEKFVDAFRYNIDVYLATLDAYRGVVIGSNVERGLCAECAKYDWRHHLTAFFDNLPVDWADIDPTICTIDNETKLVTSLGGEYTLNRYCTSFTLPGLAYAVEHEHECTFCSLLVSTMRAEATKEQFDHIVQDDQPVEISCYNPFDESHGNRWALYVRFNSNEQLAVGEWDVVVFRLVLHTSSTSIGADPFINKAVQETGHGSISPTQIDPALIPSWWQECKKNHKGCRTKAKQPRKHRTLSNAILRVIDVQKNEIVLAPADCSYLALSYVWGGVDGYLSKKSHKTRDLLTEDEIIPFSRKKLPKTIRDAIRVTEMIGERYLWVDALCIVQDDGAEKTKTIAVMNDIYQNAVLTIVAADGKDVNAGLTGLDPGSRHIRSVVGSVDNIYLTLQEPAPELSHSVWSTRAWTYQEEQFSRRLLVFAHDRVYYKCGGGSFGEARPSQPLKDPILATMLDAKLFNIDNEDDQWLYAYTQHVEGYTSRQLTYERDILHAFEGLSSYLTGKYSVQTFFFWGLPLADIIYALAWRATSQQCQLRRRTVQTLSWNGMKEMLGHSEAQLRSSAVSFPSWSWAGWVGPVSYDLFEYPKLSCWEDRGCVFSTTIELPWKVEDEAATQALVTLMTNGILTLTADVASLDCEHIQIFEKHCADDDSCEQCRGQTQKRRRTLTMDDGSEWQSGVKEGFLVLEALGFIDDFQSHTVLLFRRDADTGLCYREGIVELQEREWKAANPGRQSLRLA